MGLIVLVFFILLFVGDPVAFAIGISGFTFFLTSDVMPTSIGVQKIATVSQSFPLLAVPFFVLAGHLMNQSDITDRLFKFSRVSVSWMTGGLAQVSIGRLFLAGIVPGLLMLVVLIVAAWLVAKRRGYGAAKGARPTPSELGVGRGMPNGRCCFRCCW
ncbi:MAG: TRAP-type mannitol/chloroaromatic compound transport system permease large subunit [Paracoccaceae bacterium]|jgi:TRAP-type mannitol/chloroaromatic compound transport system permease large subunit